MTHESEVTLVIGENPVAADVTDVIDTPIEEGIVGGEDAAAVFDDPVGDASWSYVVEDAWGDADNLGEDLGAAYYEEDAAYFEEDCIDELCGEIGAIGELEGE